MNTNIRYRPDIDGLRAVAVLAVIFFHANLGFNGGYAGVDIFFVISGYLITALIQKDLEKGRFRLLEFWERRIRRIFPALLVVLLSCLTAGWFFFLPGDFEDLGKSVMAQSVMASNIYFWSCSGYFAAPAKLIPLLHTWSLAVEEQFYLLFPFYLIAINRLSGTIRTGLTALLCLLSLGFGIYCSYRHASIGFYFLPSRAWELLMGGLLAMHSPSGKESRWLKESIGWGGFLTVLYVIFFYNSETRFPGLAAVPPCLGAAAVIWANSGHMCSVGRLLALPPLVFVGLISYSLYLWHWPLLVFGNYLTFTPLAVSQRLLILGASVLLAIFSWKWVETPFRRRDFLKSRLPLFSFAGIASACLLGTGFTISQLHGLPFRLPAEAQRYMESGMRPVSITELSLDDVEQEKFFKLGVKEAQSPPVLFLWGDSHAGCIMPTLDALCREHGVRGLAATHGSTAPLIGYDSEEEGSLLADSIPYSQAVVKFIQKERIKDVVITAMWISYSNAKGFNPEKVHAYLVDTIRDLKAAGARVWIMRDVPRPIIDVPHILARYVISGGKNPDGPSVSRQNYEADRIIQDRIFQDISQPGVIILDPSSFFLNSSGGLIIEEGGKSLYIDDNHISPTGAARLRSLFEPIFKSPIQNLSPDVKNREKSRAE